jgi:hypothetical protein
LRFLRAAGQVVRCEVREVVGVLEETPEREQIVERVAALDIGKAELVCCVRVPGPPGRSRRVQEVTTCQTMTRSLLAMVWTVT